MYWEDKKNKEGYVVNIIIITPRQGRGWGNNKEK